MALGEPAGPNNLGKGGLEEAAMLDKTNNL